MFEMDHEFFMRAAIKEAKKGFGKTSPNPCVGAVIVKNGEIIGSGYHEKAGGDHAEVAAIKNSPDVRGATMYVTMEPCCHFGKTPPCVDALLKAGIKEVFVAHKDPSKKVNGKGIKFLKKNGVEVHVGLLEKESSGLNQPFLKVSKISMPFVTVKAGISLDGKISTGKGKSEWITNELSRKHGHKLRDFYDAIVVGANTVIIDNPVLAGKDGKLLRVIIDGKLRTLTDAKVYRDGNVFVACADSAGKEKFKKFIRAGIKIKSFGKEKVDIKKLLKFLLKEYSVQSVFVEGGGATNGTFADAKVLDDVYFYISPEIIGGEKAIGVFGGVGAVNKKSFVKIKKVEISRLKSDILIHGIINEY
jgi:diaminohydroxyphosphoribosylaminopyrimidine deaminase/5-amino-6-(5-phosphoribosylamino)uracil reductase